MEFDDDIRDEALEKANERWNVIHSNYERAKIKYDDWLELFQRAIDNCKTPIIDLGCGSGNDTLYLVERGKKVIPCDYSRNAVQNIQKNFPEVERTECFDMTKGLPFEDNFTDIIISDLSLHYFTERKTFEVLNEIKRVLKPDGILLFRVNSVKDVNYGAGEGKEIEPHLYKTSDGRYKRFFDAHDLEKFFTDWEKLYIHEETMGRYDLQKVLWRGAMQVKK
ncbi:MAG: class I SAM-dependent methyltransferase [Clostridia bacterium]|nr:class I SAM-dependent methyltransferase [Clostridia bacterium]